MGLMSKTSQLTETDRRIIANVRRLNDALAAGSAEMMLDALKAGGMHLASDRDPIQSLAAVLCVDAMELVGLVRRLTGEDL